MKTRHAVFVLVLMLVAAGVAVAQNRITANQGKPGLEGPWPVTGTFVTASGDGGIARNFSYPGQCAQVGTDGGQLYKNTVVGTSAVPVPAIGTASRAYIEICNSLQNSGTPLLKCRTDGTAPVMAVTNPGDTLGIGDCKIYPIPSTIAPQCISDAVGTNALSSECVPL